MGGPVAALAAGTSAAAFLTWAVRGRTSSVLAPSFWHGPRDRRELALTFDDGPSESTPELLSLLAKHGVPSTFFVCGMHVRRLPAVARAIVAAGHEIGNHTESHAALWLKPVSFQRRELADAQEAIESVTGVSPCWFRAPYGVRWFGLGRVQRELGLTGVMWTVIGRDWRLPARDVAERIVTMADNGGILCLHDGRDRQVNPDIRNTVEAVGELIPRLVDRGFAFRTVSQLVRSHC